MAVSPVNRGNGVDLHAEALGVREVGLLLLDACSQGQDARVLKLMGEFTIRSASLSYHFPNASSDTRALSGHLQEIADPTTGDSLLHATARGGSVEIMSLILGSVRWGECLGLVNKAGETPLHVACYYGYTEIVRLLLTEGQENSPQYIEPLDFNGTAPIHYAALRGPLELLRLLLDAREENMSLVTRLGVSPLHLAVAGGNELLVEELLNRGADVDFGDCDNTTPLMLAAVTAPVAIVRLLLARGADIRRKNTAGCSALDLCTREEVCKALTDHKVAGEAPKPSAMSGSVRKQVLDERSEVLNAFRSRFPMSFHEDVSVVRHSAGAEADETTVCPEFAVARLAVGDYMVEAYGDDHRYSRDDGHDYRLTNLARLLEQIEVALLVENRRIAGLAGRQTQLQKDELESQDHLASLVSQRQKLCDEMECVLEQKRSCASRLAKLTAEEKHVRLLAQELHRQMSEHDCTSPSDIVRANVRSLSQARERLGRLESWKQKFQEEYDGSGKYS